MRFSRLWLAAGLLTAVPAVTLAQDANQPANGASTLGATQTAPQPSNIIPSKAKRTAAAMAEDIEIMRRILTRDLHTYQMASCSQCHAASGAGLSFSSDGKAFSGLAFSPDGKTLQWFEFDAGVKQPTLPGLSWLSVPRNAPPAVDVDGTYLKDYGVVLHVTMPPVFAGESQAPKPSSAKPVSEWERVRKELRGEKPDKAEAPPEKRVPDLADFLLKLLADNGRNFSKLAAQEKLTLIVAFRPAADPHSKHDLNLSLGTTKSDLSAEIDFNHDDRNHDGFLNQDEMPEQLKAELSRWDTNRDNLISLDEYKAFYATRAQETARDFERTIRQNLVDINVEALNQFSSEPVLGDLELLGDLQIKQGRVQEALRAYQKALDSQQDRKRKASLYQKMAQAQLKLDEKSADVRAKAIEYLNLAQQHASNPIPPPPPTTMSTPKLLTSKLILTAPKSLLDAAVQGLSFEEFRKGAGVERIAIPIPEKQGESKRATSRLLDSFDPRTEITVHLQDDIVTATDANKKTLWQTINATRGREIHQLTITGNGHVVLSGPGLWIDLDLQTGKILSEKTETAPR